MARSHLLIPENVVVEKNQPPAIFMNYDSAKNRESRIDTHISHFRAKPCVALCWQKAAAWRLTECVSDVGFSTSASHHLKMNVGFSLSL